MVFEEIVGNIVRYGTRQGSELRIEVSVEISPERVLMSFEDDGTPFDPCGQRDAAVLRTLADAPDGGFGLTIVRSVASSMHYELAAGQNRLVVTLRAG